MVSYDYNIGAHTMATIEIQIPTTDWVQLTTQGQETGSVYCSDANGLVALTESATKPTTEVKDTALSGTISGSPADRSQTFFGVGSASFVYARAINNSTTLNVSVAE